MTANKDNEASEEIAKDPDLSNREYLILSHVEEWAAEFLPPGFEHLKKWDVYETLHCEDDISIVEIACIIYDSDSDPQKKSSSSVTNFLEEDENEEKDSSQKLAHTFVPQKIETFRLVLQFSKEATDGNEESNNETNNPSPTLIEDKDEHKTANNKLPAKCIAVYHKKGKSWKQIFVDEKKFDSELDN
ncbi:hypothetical protein RFI_14030, partial [Reticulomyxa filosa]